MGDLVHSDGTSNRLAISLLHATFHREGGPEAILHSWMNSAIQPERIEYILAADNDDQFELPPVDFSRLRIVTGPPNPESSTAVRNWNSAAEVATGQLYFVIADDVIPPSGWDHKLDQICAHLDPISQSFAIKVRDNNRRKDALMRHPIISKRFYEQYGLFNPYLSGVGCDNDITARAFWRAIIVDGRSLSCTHLHPSVDSRLVPTRSQKRHDHLQEFQRAASVLSKLWKPWQRRIRYQLVRPSDIPRGRNLSLIARRKRFKALLLLPIFFPKDVFIEIARRTRNAIQRGRRSSVS